MQPNLVEHAGKIHHAARHFLTALGIDRHNQMNRIIRGDAILESS
jgi:hypothetical protein